MIVAAFVTLTVESKVACLNVVPELLIVYPLVVVTSDTLVLELAAWDLAKCRSERNSFATPSSRRRPMDSVNEGAAKASKIPAIATTIISSTIVKPEEARAIYLLQQPDGVFVAFPLSTVTVNVAQPVSVAWLLPVTAAAVNMYPVPVALANAIW